MAWDQLLVPGQDLTPSGGARSCGATLEEVSLPHTRYSIPTYYLVATAEASSNLARYDGVRYGRREGGAQGLREMYHHSRSAGFGREVKRRIMLGTLGEKTDNPLEMYLSNIYTTTANLVGLPGLCVPAGRAESGLPVGCQLLAPHFEERRLFRAGAALERVIPVEAPGWVAQRTRGAGR